MSEAPSSTFDDAVLFQAARGSTNIQQSIAATLHRRAGAQRRSARERYLAAAVDHDDFERRCKAWDAYEQGALSRMATGLR